MKLALGTAQFGLNYGITNQDGKVSDQELSAILQNAAIAGVDLLDTAIDYGDSESRLGSQQTQSFRVVTKLPLYQGDDDDLEAWVYGHIARSLENLKRDHIYGLLLHRPSMFTHPNCKSLKYILEKLRASGQVQKVGISIYAPQELEALVGEYPIDIVQAPFNLIDQRLLTSGWMDKLVDADIEIHTRSAFLQGLLLLDEHSLPEQFARWRFIWKQWDTWCRQHPDIRKHSACLAFIKSFPQIHRVIVGVTNDRQLSELLTDFSGVKFSPWPSISSEDRRLINPSNWNLR